MTKTDWDALLPRLLLFAEGSRRACKREKDADEALIHQETAVVLEDAAKHIETRDTEIKRIKSISTDLLEACEDALALMDEGLLVRDTSGDDKPDWAFNNMRFVLRLKGIADAIARANEELKP